MWQSCIVVVGMNSLTVDAPPMMQVLALQADLARSLQEGKELRRMLAAWEALRIGKDAQIAALLQHCTTAGTFDQRGYIIHRDV